MAETILNPLAIAFDLTSLPVVVVGILTGGFGLVVVVRERGSALGIWYALFAGSVAIYLVAAGLSYAVLSRELSLVLDRIAHVGVSFIPATLAAASASILGTMSRYRRTIWILMAVSAAAALLALASDLFIEGNQPVRWGYYPCYGPFGYAFVAFFAVVTASVLVEHVRQYRRSADRIHRRRIGLSVVAISVGLLAAVDFLPALGVPIYAYGFIPISVFVMAMGYVVTRYRLVDITPEVAASGILETMQGAVIVTDRAGVVRVANPVARRWLATERRSLVDQPLADVLRGRSVLVRAGQEAPRSGSPAAGADPDSVSIMDNGQYEWTSATGEVRMVDVTASDLTIGDIVIGTVYAAHDVTPHKDTERALAELALHDALTGLPNRVLLYERIEQWIHLASRSGSRFAVLFVDLDKFKSVNDRFGHEAGDQVLRVVAQRFRSVLRETDTVARMGGDEFVIVVTSIQTDDALAPVVAKLARQAEAPIDVPGEKAQIGASIGVAIYPADGADPESLVRAADAAMYRVKHGGEAM